MKGERCDGDTYADGAVGVQRTHYYATRVQMALYLDSGATQSERETCFPFALLLDVNFVGTVFRGSFVHTGKRGMYSEGIRGGDKSSVVGYENSAMVAPKHNFFQDPKISILFSNVDNKNN